MKTILLVDDELSVREVLKEMLNNKNYQVETAASGKQALIKLDKCPVDLVVTDIVMADENGIDLIMKMKTDYPHIPVVAISGGGGIEGRFNYLEIAKLVGAKEILKKPFSAHELREAVEAELKE